MWPQARPDERRRDDPLLASRAVAERHRARQGHAGEGRRQGHRPAAAFRVSAIVLAGAGIGVGDVVAVARNRLAGTRGPELSTYAELPVRPMGDTLTRYHVSLDVDDRPGVLAPVAEAFARHDVSIQAVRQTSRGDEALLIIVTHEAPDAALAATVSELQALPVVRAVASVMRVEGEEDPS